MKRKIFLLIIILGLMSSIVYADQEIPYKIEYLIREGYVSGRAEGDVIDYALDQTIKRSEVTKMLIMITDKWTEEDVENLEVTKSRFSDVPSDHWALNYIELAADMKMIQGDETGLFNPEGNVTVAELCAMLVRMDNRWQKEDDLKATWPDTYIDVARDYDLFAGLQELPANTVLDRNYAFQMMTNHLMYKSVSG